MNCTLICIEENESNVISDMGKTVLQHGTFENRLNPCLQKTKDAKYQSTVITRKQ